MRTSNIALLITTILGIVTSFGTQTAGHDIKCEIKEKNTPFDNRHGIQFRTVVSCVFNEDFEITVPSKLTNPTNESVTELRMNRNKKIEFLPQEISTAFPKLRVVDAFGCAVKEITKSSFLGLKLVDKIVLDGNEIATIDESSFDDLSELRLLYLDNNRIATLPTKLFEKLENLDTLYLNGNQLQELDAALFKNNRKLALLHINENKLQTLPPGIFDGMTQMRQIWLKGNEIVDLPANIFEQCASLVDIDLSRNRIKTIDPNLLTKLGELRDVSFSFNPLEFIDLTVFDGNTLLTEMFFNGIATADIRNIERVDQMKNIKGLSFHNGCINDQFHEGNLEKLKEIVRMRCIAAVKTD
ncbi:hypothetical protein HA402_005243 [Bradysia odoriphaga]|nr:hypothetical protein HA402_005243 [Bradysia odoriphaga]